MSRTVLCSRNIVQAFASDFSLSWASKEFEPSSRLNCFQVIDSWEEISAADAPQLPKSAIKIETPQKKDEADADVAQPAKAAPAAAAKHDGQQKKADKSTNKKAAKNAEKVEPKPEVVSLVEQMEKLTIQKGGPKPKWELFCSDMVGIGGGLLPILYL